MNWINVIEHPIVEGCHLLAIATVPREHVTLIREHKLGPVEKNHSNVIRSDLNWYKFGLACRDFLA